MILSDILTSDDVLAIDEMTKEEEIKDLYQAIISHHLVSL